MFKFFKKDPIKLLEKEYEEILVKARDTQRSGDIKEYARLMSKSEEILQKIEALRSNV
ncbi:MAG: Lacal_2735 family protein [Saprospiraceae bacterium]|nr:Lacal_2735 family protein [Saprospiraceae bacterium]